MNHILFTFIGQVIFTMASYQVFGLWLAMQESNSVKRKNTQLL